MVPSGGAACVVAYMVEQPTDGHGFQMVRAGMQDLGGWPFAFAQQPIARGQMAVARETFHSLPTRLSSRTTRFWSTFSLVVLTLRRYWLR